MESPWMTLVGKMRRCFRLELQNSYFVTTAQLRAFALGSKVLSESDVLALPSKSRQRLKWLRTSEDTFRLVNRRDYTSFARLHGAQHGIAECDTLPEVFVKGLRIGDHHIRAKAIYGDRRRRAAIQLVERSLADDEKRRVVMKSYFMFHA